MDRIFIESKRVGSWTAKKVDDQHCVEAYEFSCNAGVVAHYDEQLRVLVVDCAVNFGEQRLPTLPESSARHLITVDTQAEAQRKTIEIADGWYARIATLPLDDKRPDDELIGEEVARRHRIRQL